MRHPSDSLERSASDKNRPSPHPSARSIMETKETYLPMTLFGSSKKRKPILDPLPPPGPRPRHHRARPRCSVVRLRAGVARLALRPPPSSAATTTSVSRRRPLRRAPDFQYSASPADALRCRRAPSAVASRLRRRPRLLLRTLVLESRRYRPIGVRSHPCTPPPASKLDRSTHSLPLPHPRALSDPRRRFYHDSAAALIVSAWLRLSLPAVVTTMTPSPTSPHCRWASTLCSTLLTQQGLKGEKKNRGAARPPTISSGSRGQIAQHRRLSPRLSPRYHILDLFFLSYLPHILPTTIAEKRIRIIAPRYAPAISSINQSLASYQMIQHV